MRKCYKILSKESFVNMEENGVGRGRVQREWLRRLGVINFEIFVCCSYHLLTYKMNEMKVGWGRVAKSGKFVHVLKLTARYSRSSLNLNSDFSHICICNPSPI